MIKRILISFLIGFTGLTLSWGQDCGPNMYWEGYCGTPFMCLPTCSDPYYFPEFCPTYCEIGCFCNPGYVFGDESYSYCVPIEYCVDNTDCFLIGDINDDSELNVVDVVLMVNCILNETCYECSDMNEDGTTNVVDIVLLVQYILDVEPEGCNVINPFVRIFEGGSGWFGEKIQITENNEYIIIENKIIKTDSLGITLWEYNLYNTGNDIETTSDHNFIFITNSNFGKINNIGQLIWEQNIGGKSIEETSDFGFIILDDNKLIKTYNDGVVDWERDLPYVLENGYENIQLVGKMVKQTIDGGYIIIGDKGYSDEDFWLYKTDQNGNEEFSHLFDYNNNRSDLGRSINLTSDGGYIISGIGDDGMWIIKTYSSGNIEWEYYYSDPGEDGINYVLETSDGGYISTGYSFSNGQLYLTILKLDNQGEILWDKTIENGIGKTVLETCDNGFIILGNRFDFSTEDFSETWLIKTDSNGNTVDFPE